jgi:hypothetical protein
MPLSTPEKWLIHAEQCERLAATATNPECRNLWLWLAKRWHAAASDAAAGPQSMGEPRQA